jgi:hypothetical protein
MRKKKQMEIYKCGMEAGAAPFEKKYEETAKQIRKTSGHIDELARNQRKNKKIVFSFEIQTKKTDSRNLPEPVIVAKINILLDLRSDNVLPLMLL